MCLRKVKLRVVDLTFAINVTLKMVTWIMFGWKLLEKVKLCLICKLKQIIG